MRKTGIGLLLRMTLGFSRPFSLSNLLPPQWSADPKWPRPIFDDAEPYAHHTANQRERKEERKTLSRRGALATVGGAARLTLSENNSAFGTNREMGHYSLLWDVYAETALWRPAGPTNTASTPLTASRPLRRSLISVRGKLCFPSRSHGKGSRSKLSYAAILLGRPICMTRKPGRVSGRPRSFCRLFRPNMRTRCPPTSVSELIRFRITGILPLTRLFRKFDPKVGHFQE